MRKSLRLPLVLMNIAIYLPCSSGISAKEFHRFIVETSFHLVRENSEHKFFVLTDKKSLQKIFSFSNIETLYIKPLSGNPLFRKIWLDVKLPAILKKIKADLFISFFNACSSSVSIPQAMFVWGLEKVRKTHLKKAWLVLAPNNLVKRKLIEKYGVADQKIAVVYPSVNRLFEPIREDEKQAIKNKYSDSKEFFLFNSLFSGKEELISLLRSFSHFKKRQQSTFQLLLATQANSLLEKSLDGYKYRNDVKLIDVDDIKEQALITASAYAVILSLNHDESMIAAFNAMASGVPVITVKNSVIHEVAAEAVLLADSDQIKDIGEKMIQVYIDENSRSKLIEKGRHIAATYTDKRSAEVLWQSILKCLR